MEIALIIVAAFLLIIHFIQLRNQKKRVIPQKTLNYNQDEHSLEVLIIDEKNAHYLDVEKVPILKNIYNPASATYTGVSVGGITTGGWDIKEAHYSSNVRMSDRYNLFYTTDKIHKQIIHRIDLLPNDAEVARNNPVLASMLTGNSLIIKRQSSTNSVNSVVAKTVWEQSGDLNLVQNVLSKDLANQNLTQDELREIIRLLCGGDIISNSFKRFLPLYLSIFLVLADIVYICVK